MTMVKITIHFHPIDDIYIKILKLPICTQSDFIKRPTSVIIK